MEDTVDDRLRELGRRIEGDPAFGFLHDLARLHPASEAFVVGGIVRDAALGREAKDFDFIVRGVPIPALEAFLRGRGRVDLVGRNFGVFKFIPRGWADDAEPIDIALPRTEHAEGTGGYRDVAVQSDPKLTVEDDLARRDFTMNAMAWDVRKHVLVDPFGGRGDLAASIIRTVGNPHDRFTEDRSRMLRALRFAAQLGFTVDADTLAAIRERMAGINEQRAAQKMHPKTTLIAEREFITPRETVATELIKSFLADPARALDLWDQAGAIEQLMPELLPMKGCTQPQEYHHEGDVWQHTRLALSVLHADAYRAAFGDERPSALLTFAVLFHDIAKPVTRRTPEEHGTDRIRFDGHDTEGGRMARTIARRLSLSAPFPDENPHHIATDDLGWLVDHHLLLVNDPEAFRPETIAKHFIRSDALGTALLRLSFADGAATRSATHPDGTLGHFYEAKRRVTELEPKIRERERNAKLPPVLDGNEIMTTFALKPGPHMRELVDALRTAQLRVIDAENRDLTKDEGRAVLAPLVETLPKQARRT